MTTGVTPNTRQQPIEDLPSFRSQAKDTYESTYEFYYKGKQRHPTIYQENLSKAPDSGKVNFAQVQRDDYKPTTNRWKSTSNSTYGHFMMTPNLMRAQNEIDNIVVDQSPLEGDLETAPPMVDIPTTAYYHGPMPDRAIKQHFLTKKTTSSVVDGSGKDQVLDVAEGSAEPGFYYLRDADGSRKTLEIRDPSMAAPVPASKSVGGMPMPMHPGNPAVTFSGLSTQYIRQYKDPQPRVDKLEKMCQGVTDERVHRLATGVPYGETHRITVPKVFKHEMGVATTDRKIEMRMAHMVPDPNPARATACMADKMIYTSAPDHITSG
eukprot:CAMPEP_0173393648 /NCGR_PEP_ID=MMETSP1356-20130122/22232_1 /TAXON_ID=77927 ORGANISM="Hemiselmis virescens, Strain PCC157" /NCGR_SAMPLE_ID=MMETSP1356 /ASSEMBLY_ACC=CAM_ASM_000847 /LENGTH=321 /DNA_ID=CAMNT_0014351703 /DNA_START=33 /DNA_END=998 /DNA_ORIENTATION=-